MNSNSSSSGLWPKHPDPPPPLVSTGVQGDHRRGVQTPEVAGRRRAEAEDPALGHCGATSVSRPFSVTLGLLSKLKHFRSI